MSESEGQSLEVNAKSLDQNKNIKVVSGEVTEVTLEGKSAKHVGEMRRIEQIPAQQVNPEVTIRGAYQKAQSTPNEHLGKKIDTNK